MSPHKAVERLKSLVLKKQSPSTAGRDWRKMEGKRVAAAGALYLLIMLSGQQQQVTGLTQFCGCFGDCYPGCREGHPRWFCKIACMENCAVDVVPQEVPVAASGAGAGDCSKICLASICGAAEATAGPSDAGGAAACVSDCTENWKRFKNKHT